MNNTQTDMGAVATAVLESLRHHASLDAALDHNPRSPVAVIRGTVTTPNGRAIKYRMVITDATGADEKT